MEEFGIAILMVIYFYRKGQLKLFKPHIPIGYLKFGPINPLLR